MNISEPHPLAKYVVFNLNAEFFKTCTGHAGCAFLQELGMACEFKVVAKHIWIHYQSSFLLNSVTYQQLTKGFPRLEPRFLAFLTIFFFLLFCPNVCHQTYPTLGHSLFSTMDIGSFRDLSWNWSCKAIIAISPQGSSLAACPLMIVP